MAVKSRFPVLRQIFTGRLAGWLLAIWALLGSYDLFVSQLLPDDWATKMPKAWRLISMTSGWLSWQSWIWIFAALLVSLSLEYAFRVTRKVAATKTNQAGNQELKHDPFSSFIEECKKCDPSYTDLPRPLEVMMPMAFFCIEKMRRERNKYDFSTINEVSFRHAWTGHMNKFFAELRYVLLCLNRLGYIDLELIPGTERTIVLPGTAIPTEPGDYSIKFRKKYLDTFGGLVFQ